MNENTVDMLAELNSGLDMLPEGGYMEEAEQARSDAMDAQVRAEGARDRIQALTEGGLGRANELQEIISDANRAIVDGRADVDNSQLLVPSIETLLTNVEEQNRRISELRRNVEINLEKLRTNILAARQEANKIEFGVTFESGEWVQMRSPQNLDEIAGFTRLSMFFKTPQESGMLAYLGTTGVVGLEQNREYLALEIVGGRVVLKMNLGEGQIQIENNKYVTEAGGDTWHEVIVERFGRKVVLTVRTEGETASVAEGQTDTQTALNLNPDTFKFYVGGFPDDAGLVPAVMATSDYVGCVQGVKLNSAPIGMWNFADGFNNDQGCRLRDDDVLAETVDGSVRFQGDSFIILSRKRFRPGTSVSVKFEFRTFLKDGLMIVFGNETLQDFFAVEMKGGKVLFQYDLGTGTAVLETVNKYNDGQWHSVFAKHRRKAGQLVINNGEESVSDVSEGRGNSLEFSDQIYFGGFEGRHSYSQVTQTKFTGCLRNLQLGSEDRVLSDNEKSVNVIPGCAVEARVVSFDDRTRSYISLPSVNVNQNFHLSMRTRSTESDGIIFYAYDGANGLEI